MSTTKVDLYLYEVYDDHLLKKVLSTFVHFLSLHLTCCGAGRPPSLGPQTGKETAKYDNQSYLDAKNILLKILSLQKVC